MASLLVIEHKDGRQYAVSAADFRKLYADQGFKPVAYEDGSAYEPPAEKSASKADAAPKGEA